MSFLENNEIVPCLANCPSYNRGMSNENNLYRSIRAYRTLDQAKRMTSLRSRNANLDGKCSQYEVRIGVGVYYGGLCHDFETWGSTRPIACKHKSYSAGYEV